MLQKKVPSREWLVNDRDDNLLLPCQKVSFPLSQDDETIMQQLIDFVRLSQDEVFNKDLVIPEAVGLAAPQIGASKKMYYILTPVINKKNEVVEYKEHALINSHIYAKSVVICALERGEGCLSVPEQHEGFVPRKFKIKVRGFDYLKNTDVDLTIKGYEAVVFQHEQGHLESNLYYHNINKENAWQQDKEWIII